MADDVIELVSSSPEINNRPSAGSNAKICGHQHALGPGTRPRTTSTLHVSKVSPAWTEFELDGMTDEFDTTGDIDTAPYPPSQPRHQSFVAGHSANQPRVTAQRQKATGDVILLSDDFNAADVWSEQVLVESFGNKRRRLSPSRGVAVAKKPPAGRARQPLDVAHKPLASNDEFSDPFASSPPPATAELIGENSVADVRSPSPRLVGRSPQGQVMSAVRSAPATLPKDPLATSDPFASSPPSIRGALDSSIDNGLGANSVLTAQPHPTASRAGSSHSIKPRSPSRPTAISSRRREWDPISSSAPEASMSGAGAWQQKPSSKTVEIDSDSDSDPGADSIDSDDLPDIRSLAKQVATRRPRSPLRRSKSNKISSKGSGRVTKTSMTTWGKARDRQTKSSRDDAEKRRKQEEKARDKAVKDQERIRKRALADANKHLSDRKASTREMIVDLPSTLSSETKTHVEAMFEKLEVGYSIRQSPVDNVVLWRRKVCRRFNESLGHWEPVVERLVPEKYALVVMCAPEFVEMALKGSLADHVCKMDENFPDHQVIYLLEGMRKWSSSNRAILNRQFRANVRGETSSSSGRRRAAQEPMDESVVEDALLQLQVVHDKYIHHTEDAGSTGDWIMTFTQHISAVPYKKAKEHALRDVGFCMESGQVRSGDGPKDTYLRMLQEIARVSAPMAYGIATEFDSVPALVNGLLRGGPERLSNVAKTIDSKGTLGHRTIGPAVSKRMYKIFTGRDETSTEI